jgi:hypothetical protein
VGEERLAETDASDPARQVVRDHVEREPRRVGAETSGREVVEPDTVFEVADGVFDVGVTATIGFELERAAGPVGDERVVGVSAFT